MPNGKFLRVFNQLSINQKIALVVDGKNLGLTWSSFCVVTRCLMLGE